MDGWTETAQVREWEGWCCPWHRSPSLSLSTLWLLPSPFFWHLQSLHLHFSPPPQESSSWGGRVPQMWHRPHLPLTNRGRGKEMGLLFDSMGGSKGYICCRVWTVYNNSLIFKINNNNKTLLSVEGVFPTLCSNTDLASWSNNGSRPEFLVA